jgi:hypothetical protein
VIYGPFADLSVRVEQRCAGLAPVQRIGSIRSHALVGGCITITSEFRFSVHTGEAELAGRRSGAGAGCIPFTPPAAPELAPRVVEQMKSVFQALQAEGIAILFIEQNVRRTLSWRK